MAPSKVAIIGGTGVYENAYLEDPQEMIVETGFGQALFCRGHYREREIYFLARHGTGHGLPPHLVNYRANIAAIKKLGISAVIATAAVGSLRQGMPPGSRVVIDQFIDFTKGRPATFYEGGEEGVIHVDLTEPYCPELRQAVLRAGETLGERIIDGGCYLCTEGPRFETPAEIRMFALWGGDLVGMTNVPEVVLAREAGLCYATIALVSNFAAGISPQALSHQEVLDEMARGKDSLDRLLMAVATEISTGRNCGCSLGAGPWNPDWEASNDEP
jgi:5'-methylthioadenosine phosphorylase